MPDSILLPAIALLTRIGVPEAERREAQTVTVSVEMFLDVSKAGKSDDVKDSINYEDVTQDVLLLAGEERKTIEKLAEDIAQMILQTYKPERVKVSVRKKVPKESGGAWVMIERSALFTSP